MTRKLTLIQFTDFEKRQFRGFEVTVPTRFEETRHLELSEELANEVASCSVFLAESKDDALHETLSRRVRDPWEYHRTKLGIRNNEFLIL